MVAGHSNTVPGLLELLGGRFPSKEDQGNKPPSLEHGEYDRLFLLAHGKGIAAHTLELRGA